MLICDGVVNEGTITIEDGASLVVGSLGIVNTNAENLTIIDNALLLIDPAATTNNQPAGTCVDNAVLGINSDVATENDNHLRILYSQPSVVKIKISNDLGVGMYASQWNTTSGWVDFAGSYQAFKGLAITTISTPPDSVTLRWATSELYGNQNYSQALPKGWTYLGNSWSGYLDISKLISSTKCNQIMAYPTKVSIPPNNSFLSFTSGLFEPRRAFMLLCNPAKTITLSYKDLVWDPWWARFKNQDTVAFQSIASGSNNDLIDIPANTEAGIVLR